MQTRWYGSFIVDESGQVYEYRFFPESVPEILERIHGISLGDVLEEEKDLANGKEVVVTEPRLCEYGKYSSDWKNKVIPFVFEKKVNVDLLHELTVFLTEQKVKECLSSEDLQLVQLVNTFDDLSHITNLLLERQACWEILPPKEGIEALKKLQDAIAETHNSLSNRIDTEMQEIAPNISMVTGQFIGARLIAQAGGLKRLAMMPASTIQMLGAEKALFRYKKVGGKPPKHGILFQHPYVNRAPRNKRGKIARLLATKIAIAAKADFFTGRMIGTELKKSIEEQMDFLHSEKNE